MSHKPILNLEPNIVDPDGFYEELLKAHEGLNKKDSDTLNAKLVLILANHIGERTILSKALAVAGGNKTSVVQ